ncbi:hypothetical protein [Mucilaginibacter antarcticus]|uniref:FecR protein domain-containing protein n=1 Tax=Mucilaginibacter antarcticus TaxID=1855725 RepID=A0ABW5XSN2_9SPHI
MKNLILAALILIGTNAQAQTRVITNIDGTKSTINKAGNTTLIVDSKGIHTTITNTGETSVIKNSSQYLTFERSGGTTTMTSSNGSVYNWIDSQAFIKLVNINGNFTRYDRNATPFTLSVAGRKFEIIVYENAYTLEHLDGSNLITTVAGNKVSTNYPAAKPLSDEAYTGIKSKIVNADSTYTTIIKDGDTYKVKTEYTITRVGNRSIIENPDGTKVETTGTEALLTPATKTVKQPVKK